MEFINKYILGASVPIALMLTGIYFLVRLGFFPITKFGTVIKALTKNGKSSFRALALSLAGTLGVGNIVGVATALALGGAGAIFWMWASAVAASILKYAEIVLAMRRRVPSPTGFKGGAPYYSRALLSPLSPLLGKAVPSLFALLCIINCLSMGAVIQTAAVSEALEFSLSVSPALCGAILSILTLAVMRGGAERITRLTSTLVPFMSLAFLLLSLAVIIPRWGKLPSMLSQIFAGAFRADSAAGGLSGFLLSRSLRFGVIRGLFSNEAGCGTSPTAHIGSSASPCEQGFMGIVEVTVDTIILCSLTAFVLLLSDLPITSEAPVGAVISAYASAFPPALRTAVGCVMAFMILCFGFAAVTCLSHYALECLGFLSKRKLWKDLFAPLYSLLVLLGATIRPPVAWEVSDAAVGMMTLINLTVLMLARREISEETKNHFSKTKN